MKRTSISALCLQAVFGFAVSGALATEKQIQELEEEISGLKAEIETLEKESGGVEQLLANIESAGKEIAKAKETLPAKELAVGGKEFLLSAYQGAFRVVTKITPGENLGSFVLKNGQPVEACSFVSAGKGAIFVQGATGSRSIPLELLPDQFASRILLPPQSTSSGKSLASIRESKPESIKTKEDNRVVAKGPKGNPPASAEGAAAEAGTGAPDYEAIRKRNEARQREITELKLQFADLFTQKKLARQAKANDEKMFREAKIKKSQTEVNSTLKMHDNKLSGIETRESEIRQKITRLQSQME
jgi:prefoldin subunit 5